MKKLTLLTALLLASMTMFSQTISEEDAAAIAKQLFAPASAGQHAPAQMDLRLSYTGEKDGETCFYVFNQGENGGFAIIAANGVAHNVLGYADNGHFDVNNIPAGLQEMLHAYSHQIAAAAKDQRMGKRVVKKAPVATASRHNVSPLCNTKWNQEEPYYNAIPHPNGDASECIATGCVATATAQVMRYFAYPAYGIGQHTFTCDSVMLKDNQTYISMTFSADFANTQYLWGTMLDEYHDGNSNLLGNQANWDAVVTLMYHVGVACDMVYGAGDEGSGADMDKMAEGLQNYFDYSCEYVALDDDCSDSDWEKWDENLYNEIYAGYPVIYAGGDENGDGGHCFVLDGYSSSKEAFHVNWGWGGTCDGYYTLDALIPTETGTGGGNGDYSYGQEMIYKLRPNGKCAVENVATEGNEACYNVLGLEIEEPTNGFYIKGGKKYLK